MLPSDSGIFGQKKGSGAPVFFLHCLGLDHQIWDGVIDRLPDGVSAGVMGLRGHGASAVPEGPYRMGALVSDAEAAMERLELRDAVVVGLSVGGMIAQGLAVKRLDLVRGLVLANTAAKFGQPRPWEDRAAAVLEGGMEAVREATLERWQCRDAGVEEWLMRCDPVGYAGVCHAIAGTDFYTPTSGLRLPALGIAGSKDRSTPPDLVRETSDLIPGSRFALMKEAGHLSPLDDPDGFTAHLVTFLKEIGHI
ncbi:alpha/beta fold hydrolase [Cognatishimia sp. MH4019]|uniref:alpha/beta fold hydrolase n=1 Tax=Cognatishimia sp. MH4019 TaxID=2854030 RepID=UPI001CD75773|nr:alpha/beta fold hydrolase [Cognatishimia sp. MH4019]